MSSASNFRSLARGATVVREWQLVIASERRSVSAASAAHVLIMPIKGSDPLAALQAGG